MSIHANGRLSIDDDVTEDVINHFYYPPDTLKAVRGEGVHLYAQDGRRYLDCSPGTFNLTIGYSHPEVVDAIRAQAGDLIHVTSKFQSGPVNALVGGAPPTSSLSSAVISARPWQ
jgi:4-aminobutyrate aminotransferase-like enzyme